MQKISFLAALFFQCFLGLAFAQQAPRKIDFDRDIRPILSDRCYVCHGPDSGTREAELRLDLKEEAFDVIVPGKPDASELVSRIFSDDIDEVMPPPESNLAVSAEEKKLISEWIAQGATWKKHWAFEKRGQPDLPKVIAKGRVSNQIDNFVLSKLESRGLGY